MSSTLEVQWQIDEMIRERNVDFCTLNRDAETGCILFFVTPQKQDAD